MLLPTIGRRPARPSDGCPADETASSAACRAATKWGAAASGSPVTIDSIATESSARALGEPPHQGPAGPQPVQNQQDHECRQAGPDAEGNPFPAGPWAPPAGGDGSEAIAADPTAGRGPAPSTVPSAGRRDP